MELPVVYGNFLRKKSVDKARYEINKPLISGWTNAFLMFAVSGFVVTGLFLGYEIYFGAPINVYDETQHKEAQAAYNNVVKSAALVRDVKKSSVDVNGILNSFCRGKLENVAFTEITLNPKKYTLRGQVKDMLVGDRFVKNLDFGKDKTVSIGKVDTKDGYIDFTINVVDKLVSKHGKTIGNVKGVAK